MNLRDIINDSMSMLLASADKHGVAVSFELPDGLPAVRGDKTRLMQVMLNILKNSIESVAANSGEKNIELKAWRDSDYLTVEVCDNGNGFDTGMVGRLFEQGFTTKAGGAGMGLHHCRTIMDSHDGVVGLSSDGPGKGAMATVRFKI
ncbi:ATP-binding protein [Puia sp. P3]|uniref:ATP-binding protein n=1 Tax=Puia sp. P3 TaxID=3423952 RepID=UPI003D6729E2